LALSEIGPGAAIAVPTLVAWAGDRNHPLSKAAVSALGHLGAKQPAAADALRKILDEQPLDISDQGMPAESRLAEAIAALGNLGPAAAEAAPRLAELARSEDRLDWACDRALAKLGPAGTAELNKLLADGHAEAAAEAINHVGAKSPELIPALKKGLESKPTVDARFHLAWALYRIEGPSDERLTIMAEAIAARDPSRDSAGMLRETGVLEELDRLGPKGAAFAPVLKTLIERSTTWPKVPMIKTLSRIEPASDTPIELMVGEMRGGTIYRKDVFDAAWLTTVDPTGEKVVPALVERLDDDRQRDDAFSALAAYGSRAASALPAVIAADRREGLGERPFDGYLWSVSPTAFLRYGYLPRYLAIPVLLLLSLIVEVFVFRWRWPAGRAAAGRP
jgi:hypothetical protein